MNAITILTAASDASLAGEVVQAYTEVERNYATGAWKTAELDAGHFVEAVRRLIELKLFGAYTPIGSPLATFNESEIKKYETAVGDESYRILIPRVLFSAYTVRNKRGVGHLGLLKPNKIDATYILHAVKWTLAELLRLNSTLSLAQTAQLVDRISDRQIDFLWKHGSITRILTKGLSTKEKVLVLLYDESPQTLKNLLTNIKYKNASDFKRILKQLDSELQIEYLTDGNCVITPLGIKAAEAILAKEVVAP